MRATKTRASVNWTRKELKAVVHEALDEYFHKGELATETGKPTPVMTAEPPKRVPIPVLPYLRNVATTRNAGL